MINWDRLSNITIIPQQPFYTKVKKITEKYDVHGNLIERCVVRMHLGETSDDLREYISGYAESKGYKVVEMQNLLPTGFYPLDDTMFVLSRLSVGQSLGSELADILEGKQELERSA